MTMRKIKPKHTPGPWKFEDEIVYSPTGQIAELYWDTEIGIDFTVNAPIIAAAPEMLEALIEAAGVIRGLAHHLGNDQKRELLREAKKITTVIAKARRSGQ